MACRKCGSSWTTIHCADTASCPYCCKLQRCKARKNGRLPPGIDAAILKLLTTECMWCKSQFAAKSTRAHRKFCSSQCYELHRKDYLAQRRREIKAGSWNVDSGRRSKSERRQCLACGKKLASGQKKYCCNRCFVNARSSGLQTWDRGSIHKAAIERPNNAAISPWRYFPKQCKSEMLSFFRKLASVYVMQIAHIRRKDCEVCGRLCMGRRVSYCCKGCAKRARVHGLCCECSCPVTHNGLVTKPRCKKCLRRRERKHRNRLAGNHRKRCRRHGLPFDHSIKSEQVFARDGYTCHICKRKTLQKYTLVNGTTHRRSPTVDHHPYPLSLGIMGHVWENVRCACWECNTKKGASWDKQLPLELIKAQG